jgi:GNAT superfamily N-acetyltransferase
MAVTPRPATPGDLEALHAMRREFYADDGSAFADGVARAALAELLAQPAWGRVWVLADDEAGGAPAGFAILAFGFSLEFHGRDAFVDELYLRAPYRGRGLGALALAALEDAAREAGVRALHLEVDPANDRALALYDRWGFRRHARTLMTKWLTPDGGG